jgi:UDP-glucose 4-epimerase
MPKVLVTGGAGYIGSHVITALARAGRSCISIDNYANSSPRAAERLKELVPDALMLECDIRDVERLRRILTDHEIDSVIHMAGLKAVGESVEKPFLYYDNNVNGTLRLLEALQGSAVRKFVFSSSATVYGAAEKMPLDEGAPTGPTNPYGHTKLMVEQILTDVARADASWRVANLRYFNPVGAHESGRIGEDPNGIPNNLMPFICQVAAGRRAELNIFGNDYPTVDGTGVRDYIHVLDLAEGHVAALEWMDKHPLPGPRPGENVVTVNLGTGRGYSVVEMVKAFERVNGVRIPHRFVARRAGDIATCYADPTRARQLLGWEAKRGLDEMVRDAWRWQEGNPQGYAEG